MYLSEMAHRTGGNEAARPVHRGRPETFSTSRLLDFASQRELTAQIGHELEMWPQVAVKELIDNSIDAVATRFMKVFADDIAREVDAFDPGDIEAAVAELLAENPEMPWDGAVEQIVRARILS